MTDKPDNLENLEKLMQGFDAMQDMVDMSKGMIAKLVEAGFTPEDASRIVTEMILGAIKNAQAEAVAETTKKRTPER